jgi:hypothetical protein
MRVRMVHAPKRDVRSEFFVNFFSGTGARLATQLTERVFRFRRRPDQRDGSVSFQNR